MWIQRFLEKGIIEPCTYQTDSFYSNIFVIPKKDRSIFNLKYLNEYVEYHHFKMDTIKDAIPLIKPECTFFSIDLKDAYYSIPIHHSCRKYLRFIWRGKHYQYAALPQGLIPSSPRVFTKVLKPVFAELRKQGIVIIGYIDDSLGVIYEIDQHFQSVVLAIKLLDDLGFTAHSVKSVLDEVQEIDFIGFCVKFTKDVFDIE